MPPPADWQLPPGVSREVWDYLHDSTLARRYDESLAGTPLMALDQQFVERHCATAGHVVDLGCGTGRVAIPLAARGHRVTAVDLSADMLRLTGMKCAAARVPIHRLQANIVDLECLRGGAFDYALCLFATLGMVATVDSRRRTVGHAFRLLRPGGMFLLHVHSRWHHVRTRLGRRWLLKDLWRSARGRPDAGDWRMEHHDGRTGWTMHLFTRREVVALIQSAGFEIVEVWPVGVTTNGRMRWPGLFGGLRAYGFLVAGRRPGGRN
jgi:SAM-dependent methyltransferase